MPGYYGIKPSIKPPGHNKGSKENSNIMEKIIHFIFTPNVPKDTHKLKDYLVDVNYKPISIYSKPDTIPHTCPVCSGRGKVPPGFYDEGSTSTAANAQACRTCSGKGIVWG